MSRAHPESLSDPRSRFFTTMAVLLLVIVFVGFAPSFYLKIFFETRELPWYVHLHGAVLTAWFTLFLVQTLLVATRRTPTHRRLGTLAGVAAVLLVLTTIFLILNLEASLTARGRTPKEPIEMVVLGDLAALTGFSILISVGISFRHRPALHKRAMLLAFIALVGPALARIARFPVFAEVGLAFVPVTHSSLMLAIWVHDLFADKRVHATTAWGSAAILGLFMASAALARTESGKALVAAISFGGG